MTTLDNQLGSAVPAGTIAPGLQSRPAPRSVAIAGCRKSGHAFFGQPDYVTDAVPDPVAG
jgi:hypothetical protein